MSHRLPFTLALLLLSAGCGGTAEPTGPQACRMSADCPAGQVCRNGFCEDGGDEPDADTPDGDACIDADGDGRGPGCLRGPDCDDTDPQQTGVEICDGLDNDCDGVPDNGVLSACGDCNPSCERTDTGVDTDAPFDLETQESDGLALDEDGALILDSRRVGRNHIWIANTNDDQVVKLDTRTREEIGRYVTGDDPSRTSVNSVGDVYVGNRRGGSITKISGLGDETCPDTNGDGAITTSTGAGHVLPWGEDDCVLWRTDLPDAGLIRAVAAQDEVLEDGSFRSFVWVGDYSRQRIYKLDGDTGEIILQVDVPYGPYGFALDARGNLWVSTLSTRLGRIDTTRCVDTASCDVETCTGEAPEFPECADSISQIIPLPTSSYGITVDFMQRVWIGGGGAIKRYDPAAMPGERMVNVPDTGVNGVGADAVGFVWGANQGGGEIRRFDAEDPTRHITIAAIAPRGIAIDSDGMVWGINRTATEACATVVSPGATLEDYTVERAVGPVLNSPYTYSDMTGTQLRLATNPFGWYRTTFEGCPPESRGTIWDDVHWEGDLPEGTEVTIRVRTADTLEALATMEWVAVASSPPDISPASIQTALAAAMVEPGYYLEVEVKLATERSVGSEVITPRISSFGVERVCVGDVM